MADSSILAQGSDIKISTALATTKVITAITLANPAVVSVATHGYTNGQLVLIKSIVGTEALNDRAFRVGNVTAGTFELTGVDTTGMPAFVSGGTTQLVTLTSINNCRSIKLPSPSKSEIDTTNLKSTAKEYKGGLPDFGSVDFEVGVDFADPGQIECGKALVDNAFRYFQVQIGASARFSVFSGFVKMFPQGDLAIDSTAKSSASIRVSGPSQVTL